MLKLYGGINIKKIYLIIVFFVLILSGCDSNSNTDKVQKNLDYRNPYETPVNITETEAEKIAFDQAYLDKLDSPVISKNWKTEIQSVYSLKYDRDVLVYAVFMKTAELPPEDTMFNQVYYISTDKGEIIESNH